jgi:hypothetical protein
MKKQGLITGFALAAAVTLSSCTFSAASHAGPTVGDDVKDGTIFAGISLDTNKPFYTTPGDAPGAYAWNRGAAYCSALAASNHPDWHVPTKDELNVLYENRHKGKLAGTFNETGFPPAGWYWSSSPVSNDDGWAQRFSDGYQGNGGRHYASSLRCVR